MIRIDTNIKNRKKDLCCVEKKTRYQRKERKEKSNQFYWLASNKENVVVKNKVWYGFADDR